MFLFDIWERRRRHVTLFEDMAIWTCRYIHCIKTPNTVIKKKMYVSAHHTTMFFLSKPLSYLSNLLYQVFLFCTFHRLELLRNLKARASKLCIQSTYQQKRNSKLVMICWKFGGTSNVKIVALIESCAEFWAIYARLSSRNFSLSILARILRCATFLYFFSVRLLSAWGTWSKENSWSGECMRGLKQTWKLQ